MRKTTLRYWICQILGWGIWPAFTLFFVYFYASDMYLKPDEKRNIFFAVLAIEFLWNILATHTLRYVLKKINWIRFPSNRVIALFLLSVMLTGLVSFYGAKSTAVLTGYSLVEYDKREAFKAAVSKEKALNLSGTNYYRNTQKDSDGYMAAQSIKKSTGWYRNSNGELAIRRPG